MSNKQIFYIQNIAGIPPAPFCTLWSLENSDDSAACYEYNSESVDLSSKGAGQEIRFSIDGTKLYTIGLSQTLIHEWDMTTAWDVSDTVTFNQTKDFGGTPQMTGFDFSPDGTKLLFCRRETSPQESYVEQWNLSSAWDISTATYSAITSSVLPGDYVGSIVVRSGGTKLYAWYENDSLIRQFSMSTPYDVTTISDDSKSKSDYTNTRAIWMKWDGTKLYTDDIYQLDLSTPYDISTASLVHNLGRQGLSGGMEFRSDGTRLFTADIATSIVYQYDYSGS